MSGELYMLTFASGKKYIGATENGAKIRYQGHAKAARNGSSMAVHKAWRKYGAPKLKVLAIVESSMLGEAERKAIATFNTMKSGYNMIPGGELIGENNPMRQQDIALKNANSKKGKKRPGICGKNNPMSDPKVAAKAAAGIRAAWRRPEVREKMSGENHHMFGKRHSKKTLSKLAQASRGNEFALGCHWKQTAEQKLKHSIAAKKQWASPIIRRKMLKSLLRVARARRMAKQYNTDQCSARVKSH